MTETLISQSPPVDAESEATPSLLGEDVRNEIKNLLRGELANFLSDAEWRLAQAYDVERRTAGERSGIVHTEDLDIQLHQITGYTMTPNSPANGSIAWTDVHIVFAGVDYTCANGSTANKYVWFVKPASGTTATLVTGNTKPTLGPNDCLVFYNNAGTPVNAMTSSIPVAVADGAVDTGAIQNGAITAAKTDFYAGLASALTAAQTDATNALALADGSISTYVQGTAPWPEGSVQPASSTSDVWVDDDGQAYRWTGPSGTPANNWKLITDNGVAKAISDAAAASGIANGKTTTFFANFASTPSATKINDTWVVLDQNNKTKRATAVGTGGWVDTLIGTQAIASGAITDTLVASGISGGKLTAGTVTNTQIGTGIDGAKLTASTVTATQLANNAVTPTKINILQHIMF